MDKNGKLKRKVEEIVQMGKMGIWLIHIMWRQIFTKEGLFHRDGPTGIHQETFHRRIQSSQKFVQDQSQNKT